MIRNVASHDKTSCVNWKLTTWVTHWENKTACVYSDNTKETCHKLLWLIQFATYRLRCNPQVSEIIQENRVFLKKRKLKQLQERRVLQLWCSRTFHMRMLKAKETTEHHYYQMRTWRYKVISVDNHEEMKSRFSSSRIREHKHQLVT